MVAGVSLTQALYALPLTVAADASATPGGGGLASAIGWVGVGLATAGLLLEHFADEQVRFPIESSLLWTNVALLWTNLAPFWTDLFWADPERR